MSRPTKRLSIFVILMLVLFEFAPVMSALALQSAPAVQTSPAVKVAPQAPSKVLPKIAPKAASKAATKAASKVKATSVSTKVKAAPTQSASAKPTAASAAPVSVRTAPVKSAASLDAQKLKVLPQPVSSAPTDWSAVDWDGEVVLLSAYEEYAKKRDELALGGKTGEGLGAAGPAPVGDLEKTEALKKLMPKKARMTSDEALGYYQAPVAVRDLVVEYRRAVEGVDGEKRAAELAKLRQKIKERVGAWGEKKGAGAQFDNKLQDPANVIDVSKVKPLNVKQAVPSSGSRQRDIGTSVQLNLPGTVERHPLFRVSLPGLEESRKTGEKKSGIRSGQTGVSSVSLRMDGDDSLPSWSGMYAMDADSDERSWLERVGSRWLQKATGYLLGLLRVEPVYAEDPTPIMAYYDGIEKNTMDYILFYLSQTQNADGSFGAFNQYELTGNIAILLSAFNRTDSGQFGLMLNYLKNTAPQTNREKAMKARLMVGLGEPYQTMLDELAAEQNQKNGGWGLSLGYDSDVLTTLEVVLAYSAANYGVSDKLPAGLAYVLNQIKNDGAMYYTSGSKPSYYLMTETARDLLPFAGLSVSDGVNQVSVQSKIDAVMNYLKTHYDETTGVLENSTGVGDKLAVLEVFQTYNKEPAKQKTLWKETVEQQNNDGSFGNSLSDTIAALRAFPQSNLVISSVIANGSLVNYEPMSFTFTIKNTGYVASGKSFIYSFADKVRIGEPIDCLAKGLSLAPGGVGTLTVSYAADAFTGPTNFLFYVEGESESNYNDNWFETNQTFSSAAGKAAIQMYYIAQRYESGGVRGLNVRWSIKNDPNRQYYVIGFRQQGSADWNWFGISNSWNVAYITGGFTEGSVYEVTAGVMNPDGNTITYFTEPTLVQVSGSDDKYQGGASGQVTLNNEAGSEINVWDYSAYGKSDAGGVIEFNKVPNGTTAAHVDDDHLEELWTKFSVPVGATTTAIRFFTRLKPDTTAPVVSSVEIRYKYNYVVKNQKEVELLAFGSDNVSIKEADFYFWNPNESSWQYLGGTAIQTGWQALLPWYVPETLLGDGYKIKAVFTDYQGNISVGKEWGPFKIINGAPPVFSFAQPAGGEVWPLGSTQEVKWTSQSVNGVNTVSLYMLSPTGQFLDGQSGLANSGSYQWKFPKSSRYTGGNIKFRIYGEDVGNYEPGEAFSEQFSLVDTSPQPGAPWSSVEIPFASMTYNPAGGGVDNAVLAVGSDGSLHVLYRYMQDKMGEPRYVTEQLYYSIRSSLGVWGAPVMVYEKVWQTDGNLTGYNPIRELSLQLDSLNRPHIVWQDQPSGSCTGFNKQEIWYRTFDGASWSAPLNISTNQTESWAPDFAVDSMGRVHVVWIDGRTWAEGCQASGTRTIRYRMRDVNGVWSAEEQLSPDQYPVDPRLAVTDNGIVHMTYITSVPSGGYMTRGAGGWSAGSTIVSGLFPEWTDLAAGPTGKLHFLYRQYYQDPTSNKYRSRLMYISESGGVWSQAVEITPPVDGYDASYPVMTIGANHTPYVVYELYESKSNGSERNVMLVTQKTDGSWTTPSPANRISQYVSNDTVGAAYIPTRDELAVVWASEYNFAQQPHFNYANLNVAPILANILAEPAALLAGTPNLTLKATAVDSGQNIAGAEYYFMNAQGITSTIYTMSPSDGVFDNKTETLTAVVDTASWTTDKNPYTIFVRARDSLGKWSEWGSVKVKVPTNNAMYGAGIAHWQFNELSWSGVAGEVRDDSSSGNHAVAIGGAQTTTTPEVTSGKVAYFDGVDDAVKTAIPFISSGSLSISAWYKMITPAPSRMALVGGNNGGAYEMYVDNGRPGCRVWDKSDKSIFADEIYAGGWHQITCVQTYGTSSSTKLYVDGALKKITPYSSASVGGNWYIGKSGSTLAKNYKGLLDKVMMYDIAITDSQVAEQYNSQKGAYGQVSETPNTTVGYWKFDDAVWNGTAGEVKDSSVFGNNGTAFGGAFTTSTIGLASGKVGGFDGANDYVSTPVKYTKDAAAVSVSAWYATDNTSASRMALVGGNSSGAFEVYIDKGRPGCRIWDTSDKSVFTSETYVGGWHQVVCVQTYGANPSTKLYVDGVLKKTTPYASAVFGGSWHVGKPGSSIATYYKGLADEVMIYHEALSDAAIAEIYNGQKNQFPAPPAPTSLAGEWKFNEPAWTGVNGEVKDSSGNAKHGTAYGGANTTSSSAIAGVAGVFDGSNDYVGTPVAYGSGDVSISAWYNSNDITKSRMAILGSPNGGRLELYVHKGRPSCRIWDGADRTIYVDTIPTLGIWHHVVCTQTTGANKTTKLYLDGVLQKNVPYSSISAGGNWSIGKSGSTAATYFKGYIDQVAVYSSALSDAKVGELYSAGR